jgi:hypothetical protein
VAGGLDGQRFSLSGGDGDVKIDGIRGHTIYRTLLSPEASADNANMSSVIVSDLRNIDCLHFLITRRSLFQGSGQVAPQLEAMHSPGRISLRHFLWMIPLPAVIHCTSPEAMAPRFLRGQSHC